MCSLSTQEQIYRSVLNLEGKSVDNCLHIIFIYLLWPAAENQMGENIKIPVLHLTSSLYMRRLPEVQKLC